jgi:UTP--glucose-1-phosphate uridylyltransferase
LRAHIEFIEQPCLWGLGHAVWCARAFACGDAVLVLLGDHIPLPLECPTAITEVAQLYEQYQSPVYGVHRVPASKVEQYGILQGAPTETPRVYRLLQLYEKPTQAYAQQHLRTARAGRGRVFRA